MKPEWAKSGVKLGPERPAAAKSGAVAREFGPKGQCTAETMAKLGFALGVHVVSVVNASHILHEILQLHSILVLSHTRKNKSNKGWQRG